MKRIVALMSACAVVAGVCHAVSPEVIAGGKIAMFNVYNWHYDSRYNVVVEEAPQFYGGGWNAQLVPAPTGTTVTCSGLYYDLAQPITVDYIRNTAAIIVDGQPVSTRTSGATVGGTRRDTTVNVYVINEDYWVNYGDLSDVTGTVEADGSIHFAQGFAYYFENCYRLTMPDGSVIDDTTVTVSPILRDCWLRTPNGRHEYRVNSLNAPLEGNDIYMVQTDDNTVQVWNLWGLGMPAVTLNINDGGTVDFASQPVFDPALDDEGEDAGFYYNWTVTWHNGRDCMTGWANAGNTGDATRDAITWGPSGIKAQGGASKGYWLDNRLIFTDGSCFVIPAAGMRGDVNGDGSIDPADISALIDYLLNGSAVNVDNADCNQDGSVDPADISALIDFLLNETWAD